MTQTTEWLSDNVGHRIGIAHSTTSVTLEFGARLKQSIGLEPIHPMETVRIVQDDGLKRRTLHRLFEPGCSRVQIASLVFSVGHIVDMLLTYCGLTAFLSQDKVSKTGEKSIVLLSTFFTLVL